VPKNRFIVKAIFSKPNKFNKTKKFKKKREQKKQRRQKTHKRVKRERAKRTQEETFQSSHHKPVPDAGHSPNKPKATEEIRLPVSRKAKEVFRLTGNLLKALAVDRKLAQSHRSRRRKLYDQKDGSATKNPNSVPDIVRGEDDVDSYELYPPEWDEEDWFIEELWGNGQAAEWNRTGGIAYGLPCPHVPFWEGQPIPEAVQSGFITATEGQSARKVVKRECPLVFLNKTKRIERLMREFSWLETILAEDALMETWEAISMTLGHLKVAKAAKNQREVDKVMRFLVELVNREKVYLADKKRADMMDDEAEIARVLKFENH